MLSVPIILSTAAMRAGIAATGPVVLVAVRQPESKDCAMLNIDLQSSPAPASYAQGSPRGAFTQPTATQRADPGRYIRLLSLNKWLVIMITALVTMAGAAYALFSPPVYKATLLLQVEDTGALPAAVSPGDALKPFDIKTAGATELEVLRSRMVLSAAVDSTKSYIEVHPNYFPIVGAWAARQSWGHLVPSFLPVKGYVWQASQPRISVFNVPTLYERLEFQLAVGPSGSFVLSQNDHSIRLTGQTGVAARWQSAAGPIEIKVDALDAPVASTFHLVRQPRLRAIEKLQRDIEIGEKGRQSGVISVALEDTDRERAMAMLQAVVRQYLHQNELRRSEGAEKQLAFLERQLPELKQGLESAESAYNKARNKWGSVDLGEEGKGLLQFSISSQTKMQELQQKRSELSKRYENAHPAVVAIDQQIQRMSQDAAQTNQRIKNLPSIEQEILRLRRDLLVSTEVYTNVMNAAQQLQLASASRVGNVRLLDNAELPVDPVKPKRGVVVISALVLGFLLSVFLVLSKKLVNGRIDSPEEIEQTLGLPVTAIILHSRQPDKALHPGLIANHRDGLAPDAATDIAVEGIRRLQSCLPPPERLAYQNAGMYVSYDKPSHANRSYNNVLAFVGPTPGVGKSFVSYNFAIVLAASHKRILLVDADLRTGALHRRFGLERGAGLAEAIAAGAVADNLIHPNVLPNLDFMSTGRLEVQPADMLSHPNLGVLLKGLANRYDYVILDTAPILAVADTLMLVPHTDILFNVVRSGMTTISEIQEVDKQLRRAGAKADTLVYNDMKTRQSRYGYSALYG